MIGREGRRFLDAGRALRGARWRIGNLTFAVLYVVPWFATSVATIVGSVLGAGLGVNPAPSAWIFVIVVSLLHTAIIGAIAIRYLAIADEVPDALVRAAPERGASRSRGARTGRA